MPPAPRTLAESGLTFDQVLQLVVKLLHVAGDLSGAELGERLGLRYSVLEPVLQHLRTSYLCEVLGGGLVGGPSFIYRASDAGRARAMLFLEQNRYVGAAPVPFRQYELYMRAFDEQSTPRRVTRAEVQRALSHLVLGERVIDQLGPAVNGGHSLFVYGPPGNGKTVIAQGVKNLLHGDIAIPARHRTGRPPGPGLRSGRPRGAARSRSPSTSTPAISPTAAGCAAAGRWSRSAASCRSARSNWPSTPPPATTGHRSSWPPTAASWSSTTSAGSAARRSSCSTAGSPRSRAAPTT